MNATIPTLLGALLLAGAAAACPQPDLPDRYGTYRASGADLYTPRSFNLQAGGNVSLASCRSIRPKTDTGTGYFADAPDYSFDLSGMSKYSLAISVVSRCDAVLLINTGSVSWYFDDDDHPTSPGDPRITLSRPANGRIDIWVGTFDGTLCDATLTLETFNR